MDGTPPRESPVKAGFAAGGALRTLTIDRPEKANALDAATADALADAVADACRAGSPFALRGRRQGVLRRL